MNNILLCGFMGCGKTTVGKRLAKLLGMEYIDLDAQIEEDEGIPIPEIFARHGEGYFRDLEHDAIGKLSKRISCVVSTGGGAMTFSRNARAVDPWDHVVFLDASFEVCYERVKDSDRPLLRGNSYERFHEIYQERRAAYQRAATLTVDGDGTADAVAADIIAKLDL